MKYTKNTTGKDKKNIVVTEGGSIWTNAEKAGFFLTIQCKRSLMFPCLSQHFERTSQKIILWKGPLQNSTQF